MLNQIILVGKVTSIKDVGKPAMQYLKENSGTILLVVSIIILVVPRNLQILLMVCGHLINFYLS